MAQAPMSYAWFSFPFYAPWSGAVTQDISTQLYQGVPEIEVAVITEAGSFGAQLGTLTKAVLALAARIEPDYSAIREQALRAEPEGEKTPLEELIVLDRLVDEIKERHRSAAEREARRALERFRKVDAKGFARFAETL